jgi:hypothetical protein
VGAANDHAATVGSATAAPRGTISAVIGLKINPIDAPPFIAPLTFPAAKDMAMKILKTLLFAAPELFPFGNAAF